MDDHDSGTTPLNDHIKLATGPWTSAGYGAIGQITGSSRSYNKIAIFCFTSFDGGATFGASISNYQRWIRSNDGYDILCKITDLHGLKGEDAGTPDPRAEHRNSNAYHRTGADILARSTDSGESNEVLRFSTAFPQTDAGGKQILQVKMLLCNDLDGNPWDGNGHYAPNEVHYDLYVTFGLNALDEEPVFHTRRLTTDRVSKQWRLCK